MAKNKPNITADVTITVWAGPHYAFSVQEHIRTMIILPADFEQRQQDDKVGYFTKHADRFFLLILNELAKTNSHAEVMLRNYLLEKPEEVGLNVIVHSYIRDTILPVDLGSHLRDVSVED